MSDPVVTIRCALRSPERDITFAETADVVALTAIADAHRVLVVLGAELRRAGSLERWPSAFREAFARAECDAAALDCIRHRELSQVVAALNAAGVRALLFKGAALAYTHYAAPHLRARTDTDVLIPGDDLGVAGRVLESLGYTSQHETTGELVSYQRHFGKRDQHGVFHAFDVHWKISNRQALADQIGFEELWSARLPLARLGSAATVPAVHALLLALVHRAGHHPGSSNMLWVWDLHLLASPMCDQELREFTSLAAARGLGRLASDGLAMTRDWFGTAGLDGPIQVLNDAASRVNAAPIMPSGSAQSDIVRQDLQALTTWRERGRLVREHLFPPPNYIRGK